MQTNTWVSYSKLELTYQKGHVLHDVAGDIGDGCVA